MHETEPLGVYSDIYLMHHFSWLNRLKSNSVCRNMNTRTLKISGLPPSGKRTTKIRFHYQRWFLKYRYVYVG